MCIRDSGDPLAAEHAGEVAGLLLGVGAVVEVVDEEHRVGAVSYTHLTLPTSDLV